jgi:hypothetical protein
MIERLRRAFNASWSAEAYEAYKARLASAVGAPIPFRVCESPVFLPPELRDAMIHGALEIFDQLLAPAELERGKTAVPGAYDVPGCDAHPLFAVADFAIAREDGKLVPRLIELQGFPSLYGFQLVQARLCREMLPGEPLAFLPEGLDETGYVGIVGEAITAGLPVENVVLMDLDPKQQGTYPDFAATEKLWGVASRSPLDVSVRGRELWYERDGKPTRILRIYNRMIVDELVARAVELPFQLTDELDVQWAGHPNWFFRWSKHALPRLRHPLVPESRLLADGVPDDVERWVLKPLFSFSGSGVNVDPTRSDLEAVPEAERSSMLLMRKVDYAPVIEAGDGARSRVEVRVMFVWRGGRPLPVMTLARLSQGKMMGVKFNRDKTWVGSTSCLWPRA